MPKGNLKAIKRDVKEKRKEFIPAVLYGKGIENEVLWVDEKEFSKAYQLSGGSTLIDVVVDGDKDKRSVLIYDVQVHPVTEDFVHIDFFQVDMKEEIETDIELVFKGVAPAVKELGGTFVKSIDKLPVRCLPGDLVGSIDVDISVIEDFDIYIHVKDLNIPKGLEVTLGENVVVALTTAPRTEEEMEKLDEEIDADISQIEGMEEKTEEGESEGEGEGEGEGKSESEGESSDDQPETDQQVKKDDKKKK